VWANFTGVTISESIDFYWYLPNGTEYYQSTGGSLPAGYLWDAGYANMPLAGTPVASVTGAWSVLVYVGGAEILAQPFWVGSYTSPLNISYSALGPSTNSTYYPINDTIYYTPSSTVVNSYVLFTNVGSATYNASFEFVTPQGNDYATVYAGSFTGPSSSTYVYSYLDINGYGAASYPGWWKVLVFVNDNFSSPALALLFNIN
jgi:hypothetical protein